MTYELRPLTQGDMEQVWQLDVQVFNTDGRRREWFDSLSDPERFQGAFDSRGRLVAMSRAIPLGQHFGGRRVSMGGVASVAVAPEARGQGLSVACTGAVLRDMRERGEVISSLYPATASLYRKLGWELSGAYVERRIDPVVLNGLPSVTPGRVQRAEREDLPRVRACYEKLAPTVNGFLDRPEPFWYLHDKAWDDYFLYVSVDARGEVDGYILYAQQPPFPGQHGWTIRVRDWVAHSRESLASLFWTVGSSSTQVATVLYASSPEDPLLLLLGQQVERVNGDIRWMTRIVDAPAAIAQRGFASSLHVDVPLVLEEQGATGEAESLAANAGSYRLLVSKGEGRLEPAGASAGEGPCISMGGFASLYTGWAGCGVLERAGLLTGGTAEQREAIDAAFAGPTAWLPEEF